MTKPKTAKDLLIKFDMFIKKWCGDNYAHLIDSDENDGENFRNSIKELSENPIAILCDKLKNDKHYYYSLQSNIAMSFIDEFVRNKKKYKNHKTIHEISNNAAKNFLNILIKE